MRKFKGIFFDFFIKKILGEANVFYKTFRKVFKNKWVEARVVPIQKQLEIRNDIRKHGLVCITYLERKEDGVLFLTEGRYKKGKYINPKFLVETPKEGFKKLKSVLHSYPTNGVPSQALWIGNQIPINVLSIENNCLFNSQLPEQMHFFKISPEFVTDELLDRIKIRQLDGTIYIEGDLVYDKLITLNKSQFKKNNAKKFGIGLLKVAGYTTAILLLTMIGGELASNYMDTWLSSMNIEIPTLPFV